MGVHDLWCRSGAWSFIHSSSQHVARHAGWRGRRCANAAFIQRINHLKQRNGWRAACGTPLTAVHAAGTARQDLVDSVTLLLPFASGDSHLERSCANRGRHQSGHRFARLTGASTSTTRLGLASALTRFPTAECAIPRGAYPVARVQLELPSHLLPPIASYSYVLHVDVRTYVYHGTYTCTYQISGTLDS